MKAKEIKVFIPDEIMESCKSKSEGMWEEGKPKKWYYAIPVIVLWLIIIRWILVKLI